MTMYLCFAYDSIMDYNQAVEIREQQKKDEKEQNIELSVSQER